LALTLSPLASAMCDVKCSPPATVGQLAVHTSCHEAANDRHGAPRVQAHRCGSAHPDAVAVLMAGPLYQSGAVSGTLVAVIDGARLSSDVLVPRRPPGAIPGRSSVSSPPLRI
jgi:hypothetical protein